MKVLMLSGDTQLINGIKGPFQTTLEGLSHHWEHIDILCPPSQTKLRSFSSNSFLHSSTHGSFIHFFWSLYKASKLIKTHNYDLIVSHDYGLMQNALKAFIVSKSFNIKWIGEIHHIEGFPKLSGIKDLIYRLCSLLYCVYLTPHMEAVRTVNSQTTPKTLVRLGVDPSKLITLYSIYLDFNTFKKIKEENIFDLIFIGGGGGGKGIFLILNALTIAKKTSPSISLLIIGKGPLRQSIQNFINKNHLEDNVKMIEWVKDNQELTSLINKSRYLICTSYAEGGPRTPLEALACGTPVLSTPVGIIPEVVKDDVNGYILNWDAQDIARKILSALKRKPFPKESLQKSVKIFEKDRVLMTYAMSYKNIILDS